MFLLIRLMKTPMLVLLAGMVWAAASLQAKSLDEVRAEAERGDAAAQFALGMKYINGDGIAEDDTEAVKWFQKAVA